MSVYPTLCFSFPEWGKDSSLSPPRVALIPDVAPVRRPEMVGDPLEGVIDAQFWKKA